jgi:hypothetical protein
MTSASAAAPSSADDRGMDVIFSSLHAKARNSSLASESRNLD